MTRSSCACSDRLSATRVRSPVPLRSTRSSHALGRRHAVVARRWPSTLEPAVRAGADTQPFAGAPVQQIVPARLTRPGVVRDLVRRQPGPGEACLGKLVQIRLDVLNGHDQRAGALQQLEPGAGLDGQLVDAEMAVGMAQGAVELGFPGGAGLAGARIDQIEREAFEQARGQIDRGQRLGGGVLAPEQAQRGVIERLNAERDPVHARRAHRPEPVRLARGGVGLERDLEVGRRLEAFARPLDQRGDRLRRHQRRRPAAEEDGAQHARPDLVGIALDLGDQRARPPRVIDRAAHMAVEVAVRAFRPAERPVHVDPKAGIRGRRAAARCRLGHGGKCHHFCWLDKGLCAI